MEGFREYIKSKLLSEAPHAELDDEKDLYWDFCSEESWGAAMKDGGWLNQLISLYTEGHVTSLNPRKNSPINLSIDVDDLDKITENLLKNPIFIGYAKNDYKLTGDKFRKKFDRTIPEKLLTAIRGL